MNLTVSMPVFNYLYHHLAEIHNKKIKIINSFAMDFDEYMKMLDYIKTYINRFERFLGDMSVTECNDMLPFVIYNCIVRLSSTSGNETLICSVSLPKEVDEKSWFVSNVTMIQCNTSEAFDLLLKCCGDKVEIEKAGKKKRYSVISIEPNPNLPLERHEA